MFQLTGRKGGVELTNKEVSAFYQAHLGVYKRTLFHGKLELTQCTESNVENHSFGSCKFIVTQRHNAACEVIANAIRASGTHGLVSANNAKAYKVANINYDPDATDGTTKTQFFEPGDIVVENYNNTGVTHVFDITFIDTMAARYDNTSITEALKGAAIAKRKKHADSCHRAGYVFQPLVFTFLGLADLSTAVTLSMLLGLTKPVPDVKPTDDQRKRKDLRNAMFTEVTGLCYKYYAMSLINHAPSPQGAVTSLHMGRAPTTSTSTPNNHP